VVVGMKFATEVAEALFEILRIEREAARQPQECKVVPMPAQRKDPAALRAEVLVNRRAGAAVSALEHRGSTDWNRFGSHLETDGRQPAASASRSALPSSVRGQLAAGRFLRAAGPHAPNELPQPHVDFAFGLWKTKPRESSAVS